MNKLSNPHNLKKPENVLEHNWETFLKIIYGYRNGAEIAAKMGVTRSRVHAIARDVTAAVLDSGQSIPEFDNKMQPWMADTETMLLVDKLYQRYPGGYDQMMREAVHKLAWLNTEVTEN